MMAIFIHITWWAVLMLAFAASWFIDIPSNVGDFFRSGKPAATSTYSTWGYVRLSENTAQLARIDTMHEREIELETLKENHVHEHAKYQLETERQQAEWAFHLEQDRIKRAYRLSLFRWSCFTALLLTSLVQILSHLEKNDQRTDNRLFLQEERRATT